MNEFRKARQELDDQLHNATRGLNHPASRSHRSRGHSRSPRRRESNRGSVTKGNKILKQALSKAGRLYWL